MIAAALFAAAAVALFGLAIAAPFALLIWWGYCEVSRVGQPRKSPGPNTDEQKRMDELDNLLITDEISRQRIYQIGDDSRIPRRDDNRFDGRFGAGREVNRQLEHLDSEILRLTTERSDLQYRIDSRIGAWKKIRTRGIGARIALATYAILFLSIAHEMPSWALALGKLSDKFGIQLSDESAALFGGSAAASVAAIATLFLYTAATKPTS